MLLVVVSIFSSNNKIVENHICTILTTTYLNNNLTFYDFLNV